MGWSWAAECGVQGRGHIVRPRAHLVKAGRQLLTTSTEVVSTVSRYTRHIHHAIALQQLAGVFDSLPPATAANVYIEAHTGRPKQR